MPKCGFILIALSTRIAEIRTPRCCCYKGTFAPVSPLLEGQGAMPLLSDVPELRATQQEPISLAVIPRSCQTAAFRLGK